MFRLYVTNQLKDAEIQHLKVELWRNSKNDEALAKRVEEMARQMQILLPVKQELDNIKAELKENFDKDDDLARKVDSIERGLQINGYKDEELAKKVEDIRKTLKIRREKTEIDTTTDDRQESSSGIFNLTKKS